jgi:hypothetical protein
MKSTTEMNQPEEPLSLEEANAGLLFVLTAERQIL